MLENIFVMSLVFQQKRVLNSEFILALSWLQFTSELSVRTLLCAAVRWWRLSDILSCNYRLLRPA